jgi:hypothetical protein
MIPINVAERVVGLTKDFVCGAAVVVVAMAENVAAVGVVGRG